jgi:hypothetical protein
MFGGVPSVGRWLLGDKTGSSAPLHVFGKLTHGFLRDDATFTTSQRSFRLIDRGKNFRACALVPQQKGFLHRVFLAQKPSTPDSMADERSLVGSEFYLHGGVPSATV